MKTCLKRPIKYKLDIMLDISTALTFTLIVSLSLAIAVAIAATLGIVHAIAIALIIAEALSCQDAGLAKAAPDIKIEIIAVDTFYGLLYSHAFKVIILIGGEVILI